LTEFWFAMRADLVACSDDPGIKGRLCRFLTFGRRDISATAIERDHRILRVLGSIGVPLAVAFHGGVGALFGVIGARPFWHGGLTPVVFLVGALASGGALLTFLTALWGPGAGSPEHQKTVGLMGRLVLGILAFDLILEWAEFSTGLFGSVPSLTDSIEEVLFGRYWWAFWIVHIILGSLIPIGLLVFKRDSVAATAVATGLIAATFLTVRLNIVLPGLSVEELEGLRDAFTGPGLTFDYLPSVGEWLVFFWAVSFAGLLFLVGTKFLPVTRERKVA
jgi:Ni/Fe-hydrogenase subunit HybB-like protein